MEPPTEEGPAWKRLQAPQGQRPSSLAYCFLAQTWLPSTPCQCLDRLTEALRDQALQETETQGWSKLHCRGHGAVESLTQSSRFLPPDSQLGVTCRTDLSSWARPSFHLRAPAPCDQNA